MSKSYTRIELAKAIAEATGMNIKSASGLADFTIDQLKQALVSGRPVMLRGFASLVPYTTPPRLRNIPCAKGGTPAKIAIPAQRKIRFVPGKELIATLNPG